jgi:adenosine deaminase
LGARSDGRDTIWPVATPADAFDRLPKVELHRHVEGTMRPATVVELARRNGVALPTADPTLLYQYDSLDSFLAVFWLVQSTLATRDHWARLAYETVVDGAAHGIVHREAFFTPARHLAGGHDLAAIVGGLHDGIAAAEAETGVTCLLIADIDRAYGPSAGLELVKRLAELRHSGAAGMDRVVSVGMDSTERGIDPASYRPAFAAAHADGFRLTAHQGENSPAAAIVAAIDVLGVERIDHGLSILEDPELVSRVAAARIPLTVCPTSNVRIANAFERLEDHVRAISNRERRVRGGSDGHPRSTGTCGKIPGQPCFGLRAWTLVNGSIRGDHDFPDVSVRSPFPQLVAVSPNGRASYVPDL